MAKWIARVFICLSLITQGFAQKNPTGSALVFPSKLHIPVRKATKFHLFLYTQNRVKVKDPQGIAMTRLKS